MASVDSLQARQLTAEGVVLQARTDTPVAIRLRYIGTGTVTSVTVTTATNIVMVTSDGGTDTYAFGTYTTVGALVDKINSDAIFEAKVLDTLRSYATASKFVDGAITSGTVAGTTVWDVLVDTSTAKYFALRLTADRGFSLPTKLIDSKRVHLKEFKYYATLGGAAAGNMLVYEVKGGTEQLVLSLLSVSATLTTENWASGYGFHTAQDGYDIVVILKDGVTLTDATTNFLTVNGLVE